jgi:hypothetical protein
LGSRVLSEGLRVYRGLRVLRLGAQGHLKLGRQRLVSAAALEVVIIEEDVLIDGLHGVGEV